MVEGCLVNADFPPELTVQVPEHPILPSAASSLFPCGLRGKLTHYTGPRYG